MKTLTKLFLLLCSVFTFAQNEDSRLKGLDKDIEKWMKAWKTPGLAIAVVEKDKIIYSKGFGYRDLENKKKVDANTLFCIGSCTKAFTVTLLGQQQDSGRISFDDPVKKHMPTIQFYNDELTHKVTIKDMIVHRTGLPRHDVSWYYFNSASGDSLIARLPYLEPEVQLREKFIYNNFMYLLQGELIEELTGQSWRENLQEHILSPLEMNDTKTSHEDFLRVENRSLGYKSFYTGESMTETPYFNIAGMSPAGGVYSSVNNMANWLQTWIAKGVYNDKRLFSQEYYDGALTPQMATGWGKPDEDFSWQQFFEYSYGWMMSSIHGHYVVTHDGGIDGFGTTTAFFPHDDFGFIILANSHSPIRDVIGNAIISRILDIKEENIQDHKMKEVQEWIKNNKKDPDSEETRIGPNRPLDDFIGVFEHKGYGEIKVSVRNDSAFAQLPYGTFYLKPFKYNVMEGFLFKDGKVRDDFLEDATKFNFQTDLNGSISQIDIPLQGGLDPIEFSRIEAPISLSKEQLLTFVGQYNFGGKDVASVYIDDNGVLRSYVKGQKKYKLIPVKSNRFFIESLPNYFVEFRSGEEGIDRVVFIQPDGTYTAKKIR